MSKIDYDARQRMKEVEKCIKKCRLEKGLMLEKCIDDLKAVMHTLESNNDTYVLLTLSGEDKKFLKAIDLLPEGVL